MTPSPLRLTGRSTSHFTRVVRVFAHELGVPLVLDAVHDLTSLDTASYGGHPALKIPTLHTDDGPLFGTANICQKIAEIAGRSRDPRVVLPHQVTDVLVQSAQELVWHAMGAQVQLIVGLLFAKLPAENVFFTKAEHGLLGALGWLEARLEDVLARLPAPRDTSVFEVSLFCLVEHLVFRPTVSLDAFPKLRAFAAQFAARESAQRTLFRLESAPPG
jgi:glutathione S-transferase